MRTLRFLALTALASLLLGPVSTAVANADLVALKESPTTSPSPSPTTGFDDGSTTPSSAPEGPAGVSVPRVMLQSLITNPESVTAGSPFTVSFTLVNTSKTTRVNNIKVTLSQGEGAFLPQGGSSSLYIPTLKAEGTASRDMSFKSLPTLENRPYAMTLAVEYEDTEAHAFSITDTVAVNVTQPARADTSTLTVSPESISIGQEAAVTFSINNLGKTKLFNTTVTVAEGQGVAAKSQFVGSIEPGAAGNVELSLLGIEERQEPMVLVITYEDAAGTPTSIEKQLDLMVFPMLEEPQFPLGDVPVEPEPKGFVIEPWLYWAGGGALVGLVVLIVCLRLIRRHRQSKEQASDLDLLDGDPLVGA
ncbi:MAG: hypothetical protein Q4D79_13925 [Propionibacteriaceae bacterium]|nr:hypothetical protein [Propionibacteriaceae bacterium]